MDLFHIGMQMYNIKKQFKFDLGYSPLIFDGIMPPPFEEWWRGIKCYPCPSVRLSVRASVQISFPLNNFWKVPRIQFIFGMQMYNIKIQVKFDLGYSPLIFDGVMPPFQI